MERRAENGTVSKEEWRAVWSAPWNAWRTATQVANDAATRAWEAVREAGGDGNAAWAAEQAWQAAVARCVLGNPYRVVRADPAWRTWHGGAILELAQVIYDELRFDELPTLADAVEQFGWKDATILEYLRGPGPHAKGCFALDAVLGRS